MTGATDRPRESVPRTLGVAAAVCLACSVLVTLSVQLLRPLQEANRAREQQAVVQQLIADQPGLAEIVGALDEVEVRTRMVELATGQYADWVDPATFDPEAAARDPLQSIALDPRDDPARIGTRPNLVPVHEVRRAGVLDLVVLPIHGRGYGGIIRGHLAVSGDGNTVVGLRFHEHGETPGLGGEIDSPAWLARWPGKRLRDDGGRVRIGTTMAPLTPDVAGHLVDGISGATWTSDAVTDMLRFWAGEHGFGPYLRRITT